jgi:putative membrane protein
MIIVISWSYETSSILTGFPFGHYHYTDQLPPKIGLVPAIIMPAYFAMGYLSWTIASVLIGKRDSGISRSEILLMPILSSFVMVMWDMTMDPFNSTISEFWIWHGGGAYFGVPFVNFLGWYLCVLTFYLVFALFLHRTSATSAPTEFSLKAFWTLPILMYLSRTIEYFGNMLYENIEITDQAGHLWHTADINESLALVSIFTMIFVGFLGLVLITRSDDSQLADTPSP